MSPTHVDAIDVRTPGGEWVERNIGRTVPVDLVTVEVTISVDAFDALNAIVDPALALWEGAHPDDPSVAFVWRIIAGKVLVAGVEASDRIEATT